MHRQEVIFIQDSLISQFFSLLLLQFVVDVSMLAKNDNMELYGVTRFAVFFRIMHKVKIEDNNGLVLE